MLKAKILVAGLLTTSLVLQVVAAIGCVKKDLIPQYYGFLALIILSVIVLMWIIPDIHASLRLQRRPRFYGENGSTKYDTRKWTSKADILRDRFDTSKFGKK